MITKGLLIRLEAKTGHEQDVDNFLREALPLVREEQDTVAWFGVRLGPSTFAIVDAFPDEDGREAHLNGRVASALNERAPGLLAEPPSVERFDVLAAKVPAIPVRAEQQAGQQAGQNPA
jgi:quinol monooxygenase YgiN